MRSTSTKTPTKMSIGIKRGTHRNLYWIDFDGWQFRAATWKVTDLDTSLPNPTVVFGQVTNQLGEYIGTIAGRKMGDWTFTPSDRKLKAITTGKFRTTLRVGLYQWIEAYDAG